MTDAPTSARGWRSPLHREIPGWSPPWEDTAVPEAELAVTVHHGPHDDIDVSYGALGTYVAEHALAVAGPVREYYLVGPRDTGDAASWRTEIGWPVFRTSAG
jgi:effector-binding domain-containing protein